MSQEPYHGSSGTIPFETQFHKFEHFCMPPRAPFIILNKARGGTRNLYPRDHPALFSIIRGRPCRKRPRRCWRPRRPWRSRRPSRPRLPKHHCRHSRPGVPGAPRAPGPQAFLAAQRPLVPQASLAFQAPQAPLAAQTKRAMPPQALVGASSAPGAQAPLRPPLAPRRTWRCRRP